MKISIIAILLLITILAKGQNTEYNNWPLYVESYDSLQFIGSNGVQVEKKGNQYLLTYWPEKNEQFITDILNLYDEYLLQRPTRPVHIPGFNPYDDTSLVDCDLVEIEDRNGFSISYHYECRNKFHYKQVPISSSFEAFITWLRRQ